ncbi:GNAT family N-acetyltransferase [Streptomyces sp. MP131-18]|uniref:GNAT family N-acetyltransferase n=1 Tax=Streptomyces sp. MP131-18 TaxID=1857892 RepID=UPI00097C6202|nr:GNAT family N-acetyltransferase [Streptomyces sp. MP131-18]ONK11490.1 Acetyltransferase [Streptomyces sp. MP131-18]
MSTVIVRLSAPEELLAHAEELAALLADVVADGASLGFVRPFGRADAAAWWAARAPALADGGLTVWAARSGGRLVGTVSLALAPEQNGRHRGHIAKLMVHPGARGRGTAAALLATAERAATAAGVTLLLLDTETGSTAEHLYRSAGWTKYGEVPDYASDPAGTLQPASFFHKFLSRTETLRTTA